MLTCSLRNYASQVENILQSGLGIMSSTLSSTSFSFIYILLRIRGMPSPNSSWWNKRKLCLSCKNWKILAVSSSALVKERNIFPLIFCSISIVPMLHFFFFPSCCGLTTSSSGVLWQHGINLHPFLSLSFLHTHICRNTYMRMCCMRTDTILPHTAHADKKKTPEIPPQTQT